MRNILKLCKNNFPFLFMRFFKTWFRTIKVEVHEKKIFAQKFEKCEKYNRTKGFFHFKDFFPSSYFFFKTLKNHVSKNKSKIYTEESVEINYPFFT